MTEQVTAAVINASTTAAANYIHNHTDRLALSSSSLEQLTQYLYDYEIEHTVKFCIRRVQGVFNKESRKCYSAL